jgi:hypothetical protein
MVSTEKPIVSYEKLLRKLPQNDKVILQPSNTAAPNPEKPLPSVPIPGNISLGGGERGVYKCKICGKIFNSKEELDVHLKLEHESK